VSVPYVSIKLLCRSYEYTLSRERILVLWNVNVRLSREKCIPSLPVGNITQEQIHALWFENVGLYLAGRKLLSHGHEM
jgi:hypothetical protein